MFAYIVVGFTYGIMLAEAGYTWIHALFSGMFIYSGSLQIAIVPMMKIHTSLPVLAVASFLINSRYMFYGIGYTERFKKQGRLYPYMVIAFPDEVYGVFSSVKYGKDIDPVRCDRWTAFMCHGSWIGGGLIGSILGRAVNIDLSGIDFAATAMFVCIVVNQWMETKDHKTAYIGLGSGIVCLLLLGRDNFILPALIMSLVLLLIFKNRTMEEEEYE